MKEKRRKLVPVMLGLVVGGALMRRYLLVYRLMNRDMAIRQREAAMRIQQIIDTQRKLYEIESMVTQVQRQVSMARAERRSDREGRWG